MKTTILVLVGTAFCGVVRGGEEKLVPLRVAALERGDEVDFGAEIFPILKKNCIACHSESKAKAKLVLETPEGIRAGSENGEVIVPGDAENSVLFLNAAHREEPVMPPEKNKANAKNLSAQELALVKLWIDQGAKGEGVERAERPIVWRQMPEGVRPVYSVDISGDGRLVVAGRGNRLEVFDTESGGKLSVLGDGKVPGGGAHSDLVGAVGFGRGGWLASGGFREVKLWEEVESVPKPEIGFGAGLELVAMSENGRYRAAGLKGGEVIIWEKGKAGEKTAVSVGGGVKSLAVAGDGRVAVGTGDKKIRVFEFAGGDAKWEVEVGSAANSLVFCEDGRLAGALSGDAVLRIWNPGDAASAPQELAGHGKPVVLLGTGGGILASAAEGGEVKLWKVPEGGAGATVGAGGEVTSVAVKGDGKYVAVSVAGGAVKVFLTDGKEVAVPTVEASVRYSAREAEWKLKVARGLAGTRKAQREAALKKRDEEAKKVGPAKEALAKAEAERTAKEATEMGAAEELDKAKAALAEAESSVDTEILALQEDAKVAAEAAMSAREAAAAARAAKVEAQKAVAVEVEKAKAALASAQGVGGGDLKPLQDALAAAEAGAEAAVDEAEAKRVEAESAETVAAGEVTKAQQAAKAAEGKRAASLKPAQDALKKAEEVAKKATDEGEVARRGVRGAQLNVESSIRIAAREEEALKRAEERLIAADAGVKAAEVTDAEAKKTLGEQKGGAVRGVAFDGGRVVMLGENGKLRTWAPETGDVYDEKDGVEGAIRVDGGGGGVLMTHGEGELSALETGRVWRLAKVLGTGGDRVSAVDFSPDGKRLAVGTGEPSRGGTLSVWEVGNGSKIWEVADVHSDVVSAVRFSPDGEFLLTCAADRMAKVFEAERGEPVGTFEGHTGYVAGVAWRADGLQFATAGADHDIKVWDLEKGEQVRTQKGHGKEVTGVGYLGAGDTVVSSSGDGSVRIANQGLGGASGFVQCLAVDPGGRWIASGGADGVVRVWDGGTRQMVWKDEG